MAGIPDLTVVNFDGMATGAANFGRVASALEETLNDLNRRVQRSFQEWEGSAKEAYTEADTMWRAEANRLNAIVVRLQQVIETGHANFLAAERNNAALWSG
jgi:WXG100 family type VII secretion target